MSALIAIFIAQLLDPVRIGVLALATWLCRRTGSSVISWIGIAVAVVGLAFFIPFGLMGRNDSLAAMSAFVGIASHTAIVAIVLFVARLVDRRKNRDVAPTG
ncbi:hypothetical protein [Mesorhizobium sp. WSM2239]|uniref:Phage holin family protein n=2 Tax=unclassified Mesorhizobium TaxID=325217 RepID=A0AAU8DBK0_9HYPH